MTDCMYIVTQDELDEFRSRLEVYKAFLNLRDALKKAVDAISAAFAQVALSIRKIMEGFTDWYLEITGDAPEIYKPKPKPKRPQRKILCHGPLIDRRSQARKVCPRRGAM